MFFVFNSDISTKSNFILYLAPKMCLYFHIVYKKVGQFVQIFGLYGFVKSDLYEMAFMLKNTHL